MSAAKFGTRRCRSSSRRWVRAAPAPSVRAAAAVLAACGAVRSGQRGSAFALAPLSEGGERQKLKKPNETKTRQKQNAPFAGSVQSRGARVAGGGGRGLQVAAAGPPGTRRPRGAPGSRGSSCPSLRTPTWRRSRSRCRRGPRRGAAIGGSIRSVPLPPRPLVPPAPPPLPPPVSCRAPLGCPPAPRPVPTRLRHPPCGAVGPSYASGAPPPYTPSSPATEVSGAAARPGARCCGGCPGRARRHLPARRCAPPAPPLPSPRRAAGVRRPLPRAAHHPAGPLHPHPRRRGAAHRLGALPLRLAGHHLAVRAGRRGGGRGRLRAEVRGRGSRRHPGAARPAPPLLDPPGQDAASRLGQPRAQPARPGRRHSGAAGGAASTATCGRAGAGGSAPSWPGSPPAVPLGDSAALSLTPETRLLLLRDRLGCSFIVRLRYRGAS